MYSRATKIIQQTQKYISSLCGINPSEDSNQKQKLSKTTNGIRLHKHDANFQSTLSLSLSPRSHYIGRTANNREFISQSNHLYRIIMDRDRMSGNNRTR